MDRRPCVVGTDVVQVQGGEIFKMVQGGEVDPVADPDIKTLERHDTSQLCEHLCTRTASNTTEEDGEAS